jgi:hypothetical protein
VGQPWVNIDVGGQHSGQQLLAQQKFDFEFTARRACDLKITHFAKSDLDPSTAVIVKEIGFFGIVDPQFVWAGSYAPDYPSHWPDKTTPLPGQGYLGWNGVYVLNFAVPVFTWMHKTLDLGWIYQ